MRKLNTSHGVLYGISVYAATRPKPHNAANSAKAFFGLTTTIPAPIIDKRKIGLSCETNQVTYCKSGLSACAVCPVLDQMSNVLIASQTPCELWKNDE